INDINALSTSSRYSLTELDENLKNNNNREEENPINHNVDINDDDNTPSQNSDDIDLDIEDDFDNIPVRHSLTISKKINGHNDLLHSHDHEPTIDFSVLTIAQEEIEDENYTNGFDLGEPIALSQSPYASEHYSELNDYSSTLIPSQLRINKSNILTGNSIRDIDDEEEDVDDYDLKVLSLSSMSKSSSMNLSFGSESSSDSLNQAETIDINSNEKLIEDDDDVMTWNDENILTSSLKNTIKDISPPNIRLNDNVSFMDSSKTPSECSERLSIGYQDEKGSDYELTDSEGIDYDPLDDQHSTGSLQEAFANDEFNTDKRHDSLVESTKQISKITDISKTDDIHFTNSSHSDTRLIIRDDDLPITYISSARSPISDYNDSDLKLEVHLEDDTNLSQQLSSSLPSIMSSSFSSTSSELSNIDDSLTHHNMEQDNSIIVAMDADEIDDNNESFGSTNYSEPRIVYPSYHNDVIENDSLEHESNDRVMAPMATTEFEDDSNISRIEPNDVSTIDMLKQQYMSENTVFKNLLLTRSLSPSNSNYFTDLRNISRTAGIVQDVLNLRNLITEHENDDEFVAVMHNPTMFEEILHNNDIQQIQTNNDNENNGDKNSIQKSELPTQENRDLLNSVSTNEFPSTYNNVTDSHNEISYTTTVLSYTTNENDSDTNDRHKSITTIVNNSTEEKIENETDNNSNNNDNINSKNSIEQLVSIFNAIRSQLDMDLNENNSSSDDDDDLLQTLAKIHSINENVNRTLVEKELKRHGDDILFGIKTDAQTSTANLFPDRQRDIKHVKVQQTLDQKEENVIFNDKNLKQPLSSPLLEQGKNNPENHFFKLNEYQFILSHNDNHYNTNVLNTEKKEENANIKRKQQNEENKLFDNSSLLTSHTGDAIKEKKTETFLQGDINDEDRKEKYILFTNQINSDVEDDDIKKQDVFSHEPQQQQRKQNIEEKEEKNITSKYLQSNNNNTNNDSSTSTSFIPFGPVDTITTAVFSSANVSDKHLKLNEISDNNTSNTFTNIKNHIMDTSSDTSTIIHNESQQSTEGVLQIPSAVMLNPSNNKTVTHLNDDDVFVESKYADVQQFPMRSNFLPSTVKEQSPTVQNSDDDSSVQKSINDLDTLWNQTLSYLPDTKQSNHTKNENPFETFTVNNNPFSSSPWNDIFQTTTETKQPNEINDINQWLDYTDDERKKSDETQSSSMPSMIHHANNSLLLDFSDADNSKQVNNTVHQLNEHSIDPFSLNLNFNSNQLVDELEKTFGEQDEIFNEHSRKTDEYISTVKDKQDDFPSLIKTNKSDHVEKIDSSSDAITQVNPINKDVTISSLVIQPTDKTQKVEQTTTIIEPILTPHRNPTTSHESTITPISEQNERLTSSDVSTITHLKEDHGTHIANTIESDNYFESQSDNDKNYSPQHNMKKNIFDEIESQNFNNNSYGLAWNTVLEGSKQTTSTINPFDDTVKLSDDMLNQKTPNEMYDHQKLIELPSTEAFTWEALFNDTNDTKSITSNLIDSLDQLPDDTTIGLSDIVDWHVKNKSVEQLLLNYIDLHSQLKDTDNIQTILDWHQTNNSILKTDSALSLNNYLNWLTKHLDENILLDKKQDTVPNSDLYEETNNLANIILQHQNMTPSVKDTIDSKRNIQNLSNNVEWHDEKVDNLYGIVESHIREPSAHQLQYQHDNPYDSKSDDDDQDVVYSYDINENSFNEVSNTDSHSRSTDAVEFDELVKLDSPEQFQKNHSSENLTSIMDSTSQLQLHESHNLFTIDESDLDNDSGLRNQALDENVLVEPQYVEVQQSSKIDNLHSIVSAHQNLPEKMVPIDNLTTIMRSVQNINTSKASTDYFTTSVDEHNHLAENMFAEPIENISSIGEQIYTNNLPTTTTSENDLKINNIASILQQIHTRQMETSSLEKPTIENLTNNTTEDNHLLPHETNLLEKFDSNKLPVIDDLTSLLKSEKMHRLDDSVLSDNLTSIMQSMIVLNEVSDDIDNKKTIQDSDIPLQQPDSEQYRIVVDKLVSDTLQTAYSEVSKDVSIENLVSIVIANNNIFSNHIPVEHLAQIIQQVKSQQQPLISSTELHILDDEELSNMRKDDHALPTNSNEMNVSQNLDPFDPKFSTPWNNFTTVSQDPFENSLATHPEHSSDPWKYDNSNNQLESAAVVDPMSFFTNTVDFTDDNFIQPLDQNMTDILANYLPISSGQQHSNNSLNHSSTPIDKLNRTTTPTDEDDSFSDFKARLPVDQLGTKMKYSFTAPVIDDSADESSTYDDQSVKKNEIGAAADDQVLKTPNQSEIIHSQTDKIQTIDSDDTDSDDQQPTDFEISGSDYPLNADAEDFTSVKSNLNQQSSPNKDDAWTTNNEQKTQKTLLLGDEPWELDLPSTKSPSTPQLQKTTDPHTNFFMDTFNPTNKSPTPSASTEDSKTAAALDDVEEQDDYDNYFKSINAAKHDQQLPLKTVRFDDNVENRPITPKDSLEATSSSSSSSSDVSADNEVDINSPSDLHDADRITYHMENIPSVTNGKDEIIEMNRFDKERMSDQYLSKKTPTEPLHETTEITATNIYRTNTESSSDEEVETKPSTVSKVNIHKPSDDISLTQLPLSISNDDSKEQIQQRVYSDNTANITPATVPDVQNRRNTDSTPGLISESGK
ncbi:unnamed protein product, partial [Didymodactylos carnosus]